jgi:hypothetical protein
MGYQSFLCQVRETQNQNLEFGPKEPKEGEISKRKNLQKKYISLQVWGGGGGEGEVVKCSHTLLPFR